MPHPPFYFLFELSKKNTRKPSAKASGLLNLHSSVVHFLDMYWCIKTLKISDLLIFRGISCSLDSYLSQSTRHYICHIWSFTFQIWNFSLDRKTNKQTKPEAFPFTCSGNTMISWFIYTEGAACNKALTAHFGPCPKVLSSQLKQCTNQC